MLPGQTSRWTEPAIEAAVMALIGRISDRCPVDPDRIYLTGVNAHFSWRPMYETDVMLDWLFSQER